MRSYTIAAVFSALACRAVADDSIPAQTIRRGPLGIPLIAPTAPTAAPEPLDRRDEDESCLSSVLMNDLLPDPPKGSALNEWASSLTNEVYGGNAACTLTAPASLSTDIMSYYSVLSEFAETFDDVVADVDTDCGYDEAFTLSNPCSSEAIVFTASSTSDKTESLDSLPWPTESLHLGAAPAQSRAVGLVAAVAASLGAALVL